jgi:hypothetical protein
VPVATSTVSEKDMRGPLTAKLVALTARHQLNRAIV